VAYDSNAPDLVDGDTNFRPFTTQDVGFAGTDAFVRTWTPDLNAGPLDFGNVLLGQSSQQTLTFTVTGFGPITIDSITLGGTNPGDFTVTDNCTAPNRAALHEDDPCTVSVTFTPCSAVPRSGTVDVFAPGTGATPTISVDVTGNGSSTPSKNPQFSADPDPLTFGAHIPLKIPGISRTVTITNPGSGLLKVTAATVEDGSVPGAHVDYKVDFSGCVAGIAHLQTCQIVVTWVGHAVGNRQAILRLVDNAAPGNLNLIGLRASVPKPKITVNPGVSPAGRVVTVSGTGFAPKRLVDIALKDQIEAAHVKTDAKGAFTSGLVLFDNGAMGPHTVTAHSHGASATIAGKSPLLVVLGSLDSPGLVIRH
jgi:hypothetical protein